MKLENVAGDFIGKEMRIVESKNSQFVGFTGKIVNETKNTFSIIKGGNVKMIPKEGSKFQFDENSEKFTIKGEYIRISPENRIKESRRIMRSINRSEKIW